MYKSKISDRLNRQETLKDKITELKNKKSKLIDFKIDGTISEEDYRFKAEQLSSEISEQEFRLRQLGEYKDDLTKCLKYTCNAVRNIDKIWNNGDLELKQRLQKLIFPKGISYDLDKFRTCEISSLFIKKDASVASYIDMVPPSEFESLSTP